MNCLINKTIKNILLLTLSMGCISGNLWAQQKEQRNGFKKIRKRENNISVSGTVVDASNGKPVVGVGVASGNYSATLTDDKGKFKLNVPFEKSVLNFSGQGYQKKEVISNGKKGLLIKLYEDSYNSFYKEIVLPYGKSSSLHTAYAVDAVETDDSWQRASETTNTYLQGKLPGLDVTRNSGTPGSGSSLLVHGFNSLYTTNQPLIIVDGMIYDDFNYGSSLINGHSDSPLSNIDIKDVDSYTIIKDGASFYGTRGANGVILITTNRAKSQVTKIDFGIFGGMNFRPSGIPVMNAGNYRTYLSDLLTTVPGETAESIQNKPYMNDNINPSYYRYHNQTNWQKEVLNNSYNTNYYVKITGGDNIATYGLSVGYLKSNGITRNTGLQRYQTRFNGDLNLTKKLSAQANLSFVNNQQDVLDQGLSDRTNSLYLGLVKAPFLSPYDIDADNNQSPNVSGVDVFNTSNPTSIVKGMVGNNTSYRFLGSVSFLLKLNKKFNLQSLAGVNFDKVRENMFIPALGVVAPYSPQAIVTNSSGSATKRLYSLYSDSRISYAAEFNNIHKLSANAGVRYNTSTRESDYGLGYNSATDNYVSVGSGLPALRRANGENGKWNWMNLYANTNYELYNKYIVSFNVAADGSSRFGKESPGALYISENPFAIMPSVAAAWILSSEKFMASTKSINVLKLRASYGITGNDDIGDYNSRQYYTAQNLLGSYGLFRGNIANPALKWETVKKLNAGLDIACFDERFNLSTNIYHSKTDDMITLVPTGTTSGFEYVLTNNGAMETRGIDICISARVLRGKLTLDLGLNLNTYKSKLTKIPNDNLLTEVAGATILSQIGHAPNQFFGYRTAGVFSSDVDASASGLLNRLQDGTIRSFRGGDVRFVDVNQDGFIDSDDRQAIGNPNPDFTGAFLINTAYKRFALDAVLSFVKGNSIYNSVRRSLVSMNNYNNQLDYVMNRWRVPGQITDVPRAEFGDPAGNSRFSDRWIEDGSYLRLRTVSLSYSIPKISNGIKSAKLFITGNNLICWNKYLGYDPEFGSSGNLFTKGIDTGLEPQYRSTQLGVKIGL